MQRSFVERLYRWALLVYPRRIRDVHGDEMAEMFADAWRRARLEGGSAPLRAALRALRDVTFNGAAARFGVLVGSDPRLAKARPFGPTGGGGMETTMQDLRHALRGFARAPGFTVVAVLTIALGIGGTTAIYSIVDAAYLQALPFPDDDALVVPYNAPAPEEGGGFAAFSAPFQVAIRDEEVFESVASVAPTAANVGGAERPERARGARVSGSFFEVAGVPPRYGRAFTAGEDVPGAAPVAVVGHGLWTRQLGADPDAMGGTLIVDGRATTVVGVMPPGFELLFPGVEIWLPARMDEAAFTSTSAVNNNRILVARLAGGAAPASVEPRLLAAVERMRARFPGSVRDGHAVRVVPLRTHLYGSAKDNLVLLLGAVGLLLLIACANLANLLLVRAEARRQELAVRGALGAGRARLVRGLLTEHLALALLGGAAGVLLADVLLSLVRPLAPSNVPLPEAPATDGTVLLFALALSLATGALFGLLPAWSVVRPDLRRALADGRREGRSAGRARARRALVVAEVALTAVLLVGSGLMLHSLWRLQRVDAGFGREDRITAGLSLPAGRYPDDVSVALLYRRLEDELRALPGVAAAGLGQALPLDPGSNWVFEVEGREDEGVHLADYTLVTPGYFDAMDMEVVRGRLLAWSDAAPDPAPVLLVSESVARRVWPGESPVGRRVNLNRGTPVWREIVGVVSDVRNGSLAEPPGELLYFPPVELPISSPHDMSLVVHHPGVDAPVAELRGVVASLDASLPLDGVRSLEQVAAGSESRRLFVMTLLGIFAGTALLLAAVGLYGVVSYTFSLRTAEIGLRMAVGAGRAQVLGMVAAEGARLVLAGLAVGLVGAAALGRVLEALLYEVGTTDPPTYAAVAAFLLLVSAIATWMPAARATGVDPAAVLRE